MGSNRRYPGALAREIEEAAVRSRPVGLSPEELDEEHFPITRGISVPVQAWIRFHADALIRPDCEAVAYNTRAVQVRWRDRQGHEINVWLPASMVDRRDVPDG
ncbi:hypothetical protein [Frigoribacterium sp. UYMn621]|uniref:hypothetical protein n=1 Tax=Frigoribacterium sp. UYMn621 TaxID=3156343 RepID=UPI0033917515